MLSSSRQTVIENTLSVLRSETSSISLGHGAQGKPISIKKRYISHPLFIQNVTHNDRYDKFMASQDVHLGLALRYWPVLSRDIVNMLKCEANAIIYGGFPSRPKVLLFITITRLQASRWIPSHRHTVII